MKTKIVTALIMGIGTIAFGQGSLTPPGFPAPTMKTLTELDAAIGAVSNALEQIQDDPRTPLVAGSPGVTIYTSGTIAINQSGSYYLTKSLTVTSGDGIRISAAGITVDLNGFTIRSTSATPANEGIDIDKGHVSIFNGHIESGTIYDSGASGDQYTGSGFNYGIYAISSSSSGIHIRDVSISGCDYSGISIASDDSLVESCTVQVAGDRGIRAGTVHNCSATTCGSTAIDGTQVENCKGSSTGNDGIHSIGTVANSYGKTTSTSTGADGIEASKTVQNSYGTSTGGNGIRSYGTVANSYGYTTGTSTDADGIYAHYSVQNSRGYSKGGEGIYSGGTVANSFGYTSGTSETSDGIDTGPVQNSYGSSSGGDGIHSYGSVANSYGYTSATSKTSAGIYATRSVQNSLGYSEGGDGIKTMIVSYSSGYSLGTDPLADGIEATLATCCYVHGGENIDHKYNMP